MDIEFNESAKIKAKIYGNVVELSRPTVGMIEAFEDQKSALTSDKEKISLMKNFLEKLGMPKDQTSQMELDHYMLLIEYLMTPKKK